MFEKYIVFEDPDLVVLNKPALVVVNEAQSVKTPTIQGWFRKRLAESTEQKSDWQALVPKDFDAQYGTPSDIFAQRAGMVHRLDKETSGALILAKNPGALVRLLKQFRERSVAKEYLCLVHGAVRTNGEVALPIGRRQKNRKMYGVVPNGRPAVTTYVCQQQFQGLTPEAIKKFWIPQKQQRSYEQGFSLVRCFPKTGRTHQIRVHMAHLQHPLVGDKLYAGRKRVKTDALWCERHFLHAARIAFEHPRSRQRQEFEVALGEDLEKYLGYLQQA